jgi:cytochrome P450
MRKLMVRAFSPRNIAALEPFVQTVADEAISQIRATGSFDVIADLAFPVPSKVISHMLGVPPADTASFEGWSHDAVRVMAYLGLGYGPHCALAALARLETKITIGSLVAAFPRLELQTEQLPWLRSLAARGVSSLPVTTS